VRAQTRLEWRVGRTRHRHNVSQRVHLAVRAQTRLVWRLRRTRHRHTNGDTFHVNVPYQNGSSASGYGPQERDSIPVRCTTILSCCSVKFDIRGLLTILPRGSLGLSSQDMLSYAQDICICDAWAKVHPALAFRPSASTVLNVRPNSRYILPRLGMG
jgi:hypothetical protein